MKILHKSFWLGLALTALLAAGCSKSLSDAQTLDAQGKSVEALKIALKHLDEDEAPTRIEALRLASQIGAKLGNPHADHAGAQIMPLLADESKEVQIEAIKALGRLPYQKAASSLLQRIPTQDSIEREAVARAFENMGTEAIQLVVEKYDDGQNRPALRQLLVQIGPAIAPALTKSMARKSAEENKEKFAILIDLQSNRVAAMIIPYVDDIELAEMVKKGLIKLGNASVDSILEALQVRRNQPDKARGSQHLIEALGEIKNKRAIPQLESMANDTDVLIRSAAEQALLKVRGF